jgi:hypothetical protein
MGSTFNWLLDTSSVSMAGRPRTNQRGSRVSSHPARFNTRRLADLIHAVELTSSAGCKILIITIKHPVHFWDDKSWIENLRLKFTFFVDKIKLLYILTVPIYYIIIYYGILYCIIPNSLKNKNFYFVTIYELIKIIKGLNIGLQCILSKQYKKLNSIFSMYFWSQY